MNGLSADQNDCGTVEKINALRDAIRHIKEITDKYVQHFLLQSQQALQKELSTERKFVLSLFSYRSSTHCVNGSIISVIR